MKIHHIGYLVRELVKASEAFSALGYEAISETIYDPKRDIDIMFMENDGYVIELVAPKSENSVVWRQLKKQGATPYHICYATGNMQKTISEMENISKWGGGAGVFSLPKKRPLSETGRLRFTTARR